MKKGLAIAVLFFCLFASTTTAYSYFINEDEILLDSEHQLHVLEEVLASDKQLVPVGALRTDSNTYELEYTYEVYVVNGYNIDLAISDLMITSKNLALNNDDEIFLFDIEYQVMEKTEFENNVFKDPIIANRIEVTITVAINPDLTYEDYQLIAGQTVEFKLNMGLSNL